jgi:HAD superfamily phosphatase
MDGVLVDVTESYRETIARTVAHFTGAVPTRDEIQGCKNRGGFNDDWKLTHHLVSSAGVEASFDDVKAHFQDIFLGNGSDGLILRERWVARPGLLEKLGERFRLAILTGRPKLEAAMTLDRFAPHLVFEPILGMEDVARHKPEPDGLLQIAGEDRDCEVFYVGDTVDDARCARAAKVPFIGIAAPANPGYIDLVFVFGDEGAYAIVDDINFLEEVFAQ